MDVAHKAMKREDLKSRASRERWRKAMAAWDRANRRFDREQRLFDKVYSKKADADGNP
jgi:hypothetical protein